MSRVLFTLGLVISAALHLWLLSLPAAPAIGKPKAAVVVPVVETELARVDPPEPPEPSELAAPDEPPEPPSPQPRMVKVAEAPESASSEAGDFAGEPEGRRAPQLRINWGTDQHALAALEAGGMIIVVLDGRGPRPLIKQQVVLQEGAWHRRRYQPAGTTLFSNRLRIVDHVPAFGAVRSDVGLRGSERLAVVVPMRVERVLESAQLEAAFRRGLVMQQIDNFAGRFALRDGGLDFDITHVGETARSASP